jgi:streptogramin lyase/5-hydroxyisourate hydrolase-like protein (transthyretin family)
MLTFAGLTATSLFLVGRAVAQQSIKGQVLGGGAPIAQSTVTLFAATAGTPKQLAQTKTDNDGRFAVIVAGAPAESSLYLTAFGGVPDRSKAGGNNPAIALLAVVGSKSPARVVMNEFTTIASVWTHAQFIDGMTIKGEPLQLRIAAGNVPNFVDFETGGWGSAIQDPLNSSQTPTMANFATLADLLSACVTRVKADACSSLFEAARPPSGGLPTDTLNTSESIALFPWHQPEKLFALLRQFYPVSPANHMLAVPYMPYLSWAPSAWVLPLHFTGGGYVAGGKCMFDSEGNLWVGDNFTVGWQGQDSLWQGHATKFAPNGRPLSPITTGFTGGGMEGGTFGTAVDSHDNAWFTTYGSKTISVFDKNGKPLTPPEGINFGGRLGLMQGIIVTPNGDVWVLGVEKRQLVYFPQGEITKGRIVCEGDSAEPCKSFMAPFFLAIDQQDRIWVSNSGLPRVTRFPASDPSKAENFHTGINNSGLNIDSQGNVWITNRFGTGVLGMAHLVDMAVRLKAEGVEKASDYLTKTMSQQQGGTMKGGSVTVLRPDGTPYPGSPFKSGGLPGPWAAVVDGNDNVWISNFAMASSPIVELCGVRTEHCPPGVHTGDQISPPGGYVGGGLQMQTDLGIDPAGNIWVMNNWQDIDSCIGTPKEALSTRCGGQGVTIFYGMAKPVRAPQIGPARPY